MVTFLLNKLNTDLGNTNSKLFSNTATAIKADVLEAALTLPSGNYYFNNMSKNLPSSNGIHCIILRSNYGFVVIIAVDVTTGIVWTNTYNKTKWLGWKMP